MKQPTPFYKLAEKIGNDIEGKWFCCLDLKVYGRSNMIFFKELFRPTEAEQNKYDMNNYVWMKSYSQSPAESNADRIIALLLADQIWKDEHK